MRLKALQHLGFKEIPDTWVKHADQLTEDEQRRFIIADNVSGGDWDMEALTTEWDVQELEDWGLELPGEKEKKEDGEIVFSTELDQESNYVVLKFNSDIDFLNIQTLLGLQSTYSKRTNGKPWSKGMGRVVDGVEAIIKIKEQ